MKTSTFLAMVLMAVFSINSAAKGNEIDLVRTPLESYLEGHIKGDSKILGSALHTEGKLSYLRDGVYSTLEFPDYLSRMKLRDSNNKVQRIPYIKRIEVTGDVAIGKLVLDYSSIVFTDYMTLLKINGEWKITNKIAYSVRDPKTNKAKSSDMKAVKIPLENYMKGYETGKAEYLRNAFHVDAKVMSNSEGNFRAIKYEKLSANLPDKQAKGRKKSTLWIESIDVTGSVAIGKVVHKRLNTVVTHYLSLLEIEGEWKIVNDAFFSNEVEPHKHKMPAH